MSKWQQIILRRDLKKYVHTVFLNSTKINSSLKNLYLHFSSKGCFSVLAFLSSSQRVTKGKRAGELCFPHATEATFNDFYGHIKVSGGRDKHCSFCLSLRLFLNAGHPLGFPISLFFHNNTSTNTAKATNQNKQHQ